MLLVITIVAQFLTEEGNVPRSVARNFHHPEPKAQHPHFIAVRQRHKGLGNVLRSGAQHGALQASAQPLDATHMVCMVMRH